MKRRFLILALALFIVGSLFAAHPANASAYSLIFSYSGGGTCSNTSISIPETFTYNLPTSWTFNQYVSLNGTTIASGSSPSPLTGSGTGSGNAGGPLGPSTPYPYTFVATAQVIIPGGSGFQDVFTAHCNGGVLSVSIANGLSLTGFQGPSIPAGFVLRTITCDVAVFDAPGGHPVGDNRIKAGQTWYVNPKPVKGPDGKLWTEFFDAGYTNAYIPTSCVANG